MGTDAGPILPRRLVRLMIEAVGECAGRTAHSRSASDGLAAVPRHPGTVETDIASSSPWLYSTRLASAANDSPL